MHTALLLLTPLAADGGTHLRVLERAGLMRYERDGRRRVYRVEHARLALVGEWLAWFSEEQTWLEASLPRSVASASRSPIPRRR